MGAFISICIPAYKRVKYLERLLESIIIQTYKDFEIIISDDSDDDSVEKFIKAYEGTLFIKYYKNEKSLGTPVNWNFAISKAKGEWIKLMHDDDWFSTAESLEIFVRNIHTNHKFIFSAYTNFYEKENRELKISLTGTGKRSMVKDPDVLLLKNLVGPPSVTLLHHSITEQYDENLKWRVDSELYSRVLKLNKDFIYINQSLINIGISESQVTQSCINNPSVELPEAYLLIKKHGLKSLKNIWIYDSWWRLLRNMRITSEDQLRQYVNEEWPIVILAMLKDLAAAPSLVFKSGVFSKIFMALSYYRNSSKA